MYSSPASYTPLSHWSAPVYQGYSHGHHHHHHHHNPLYNSYASAYPGYSGYSGYSGYPAYQSYAPSYYPANNLHNANQTVGYGNYGYGVYSQDVAVHRNPFTGRPTYERELDFVPLGYNQYQPYTGVPAEIHQHYVR